jgi:hypothetical protein
MLLQYWLWCAMIMMLLFVDAVMYVGRAMKKREPGPTSPPSLGVRLDHSVHYTLHKHKCIMYHVSRCISNISDFHLAN